jgi:NAD(P)-dependent dehydrogenase (short-subunit alcohol dehydrogenase family)
MAAIDVNYVALRSLAGRTAVITGGCSGIGLATAELLLSIGCNVMLGDLHPPRHDPYQDKFLSSSQSLCYQECDITQWISLTALFDTALSKFGRIDIVCANAGVNDIGDPFFSTNLTETAGTLLEPNMKTLDINLKGTTNTIIAGMHHLKANGEGGSIIITASLAGYFGTTGMPLYTASKHGEIASLFREWTYR